MQNVPFPGGWRYRAGAIGGWLLFLAMVAAVNVGRAQGWPEAGLAILALGPAIIAAVQFRVAWKVVASQDEFVRALFARRMLAAAGGGLVIAIAWSGLESLGAPHLPAWLLYPVVWGLLGVATLVIGGTKS